MTTAGNPSRTRAGRTRVPLWRRYELWLSILILAAAAALSAREPFFIVDLRERVFDAYQRLWPRPYIPSPVRIIDIDEESLAKIGQWPWPRTRVAEMVAKARDAGAATIAFDMLFVEPDRTSPRLVLPRLSDAPPDIEAWLSTLEDHDERFADVIATVPTVAGFALVPEPSPARPLLKASFAFSGESPKPFLTRYSGAVTTLPVIVAAAVGNGALNVTLAQGGIVRRLPMLLRLDDQIYPSLVTEALRVVQDVDTIVVESAGGSGEAALRSATGITHVRIGAFTVPTDAEGHVWAYFTEPVPERYIPAWKVLAGEMRPDALAGMIVLVGSTALGLQDMHATPLGQVASGVSMHAQVLEQIVNGIHLGRPDWAKGAELVLLLGLGAFVLLLGERVGAVLTALFGGFAVAAAVGTSWYAFSRYALLFDPVFPALAVLSVYIVYSLMRHLRAEREQRWIRGAFSSYISPHLVDQLVTSPDQLSLSGERRELSFVFTDLAGFTGLIETSEPTAIVPVLNTYLDGMIRIAFDHNGTVDKIVGDAVHVMFGAPIADTRQADNAVACALAFDAFARRFAEEQQAKGVPFGETRIGVNSGSAIVGNFGGRQRFDYTAHGDAINTAARLEGANKYLGTLILVSEDTVRQCSRFTGRPVGDIVLKGKSRPVRIYEPLTEDSAARPANAAYLQAFEAMVRGDPDAKDRFAVLAAEHADDGLVAFHHHRLSNGEAGTTIRLSGK
jgi:adenylate cyclase